VNKDKSKSKRPENGMYLQMKQDLEKKIQQSMSATKVVKKSYSSKSLPFYLFYKGEMNLSSETMKAKKLMLVPEKILSNNNQ